MTSSLDLKSIRERCADGTIAAHAGEVVPMLLDEVECLTDMVDSLVKDRLRLKEALEWYADKSNYIVHIEYNEKMIPIKSFNPMSEMGHRAREALKGGGNG